MTPSIFSKGAIWLAILSAILALPQFPTNLVAQSKPSNPGGKKPEQKRLVEPKLGVLYESNFRYPKLGFTNPDGSDALHQHFRSPQKVDGLSVKWHEGELEQMMEAEIDCVLPRFCGGSGSDEAMRIRALVKARSLILAAGGQPPLIALYFDTSDLLVNKAGPQPDLNSAKLSREFQSRILAFYKLVPPAHRFTMDGFLPLLLGPTWGSRHESKILQTLNDAVFAAEKKHLFIIAERSWRARAPANWSNEAALLGPGKDAAVKVIGPGYNDTRLAGKGTPIRDREKTRWYQHSWNQALLALPALVLIDSWNDFRRGTGIADCAEYQDNYIELTRHMGKRLRAHLLPDVSKPIRLTHPDPLARPDTGWWKSKGQSNAVNFSAALHAGVLGEGLRLAQEADGPFKRQSIGERRFVASPGPGDRYLYFGIADEFANRSALAFSVEIEFVDGGRGSVQLQYDSWDPRASGDGAYKSAPLYRRQQATKIRTLRWILDDARFSNRQNGGADLRLRIRGDLFELGKITLSRLDRPARREDRPQLDLP
ncbi:MAG: hypothetical protein V3W41_08070 [Planctomycetota bacterium]